MSDALGRVIHCPHCGQEIRLDEAIVNELTEPLRHHWEQEVRQVEELAETKIAKLETQLVRVNRILLRHSARPGQVLRLKRVMHGKTCSPTNCSAGFRRTRSLQSTAGWQVPMSPRSCARARPTAERSCGK